MIRPGLIAALATVALPHAASAEGNRLSLVCDPLAGEADDGAETAPAAPDRPTFTFAPRKLDRDGSGPVDVTTPEGRTAPGVTASFQGPYAWTIDTTLHTLTVRGTTGDGRVLVYWHRLDQAQASVPPTGQLTKLICEVS